MKPYIENKYTKLNYTEREIVYTSQEMVIEFSKENILEALNLPHKDYEMKMEWDLYKGSISIMSFEQEEGKYPFSKYFYSENYWDIRWSLTEYLKKSYRINFPEYTKMDVDKYPSLYIQEKHVIKKKPSNLVEFEYLTMYWITNPAENEK
jgi:hypothetical protein